MGICRALNLNRKESVEVLSRICQQQKECLDGSRIYRVDREHRKFVSMDRESVEDLSRKEKEKLDRKESVEELLSLKKMSFSRRKNIKR